MTEAREDPAHQLWRLWEQDRRPDLKEFLARFTGLPPLDLAAVLRVDLRRRWLLGQRLPAEHYLQAYPAVAADDEAAVDLVYAEFLIRQEQGEVVAAEEFLRRFPRFADPLRLQLDFGQALAGRPAAVPPPAGVGAAPAPTERGFPDALDADLPAAAPAAGPADPRMRIEEQCNAFEAAWVKGPRPLIENCLDGASAPARAALLRELIPLDVAYRRANGESPVAGDYLSRFPELEAPWVAAAVVAPPAGAPAPGSPFRRPRAHRIRCPHCHSPIQLIDERPAEVLCPGCGSSFRLQEAHGTTSAPSMRLGKFQLLERVGRGAFGAVWRALDLELDRVVALKIPHAGLAISPDELKSFLDEARKAARLRHPGIVKVHDVTTLQGLPAIVSDFIHGVTLKDLLEARRPSFRETARLIAEVAEALDHAHANGLIHRDVKPANIMVERGGGAAIPDGGLGRPLVLDFGLALREEAQVTMTVEGEIIGTPAYINPEQAAGRGHHADRRSDVFSLGVVLYEMLCGELPFRGSRLMLIDQVQRDDPRPPRRINERVPRDLETICLKAMAKLPGKRYPTAAEMAADLRRFLQGEPVHARRAGRTERLWRWCRRRPRDAALAGVVLGLLVLLAVVSTVTAVWIERLREAAERERARAETHLTQTFDAVDQMTRTAEEVVEDTPQMEDRQQQLLESALDLQKQLLEERPTAVERKKLAWAYWRMGRILAKLRYSAETKQDLAPQAEQDFKQAIEVFRRLGAEDPNDTECPEGEGVACDELALLLSKTSRGAEVDANYRASRAILEKLRDGPTRAPPQVLQDLALTCNNYGIFLKDAVRPESKTLGKFLDEEEPGSAEESKSKADELYDEAEKLLTTLEQTDPDHHDVYAADLARVLDNRGDLDGHSDKALREYDGAIHHLQGLINRGLTKNEYRWRLALAFQNKGVALKDKQEFSHAEACHRSAIALFERLAADFPKYPEYHRSLANSFNSLAVDLKKQEEQNRVGRDFSASFVAASPPGPGPLLAVSSLAWANPPQLAEADAMYRTAVDLFQHVLADDPHDPEAQSQAALDHYNLGRVYQESSRLPEALSELRQAIEMQKMALRLNPKNFDYLDRLGWHCMVHAQILLLGGDHLGAARDAADLEEISPATASNAVKAACVYALCCEAADGQGKHEDAERYATTAVRLLGELHDAGYEALRPDDPRYKALHLKSDYLQALRHRDDFKRLLPKP